MGLFGGGSPSFIEGHWYKATVYFGLCRVAQKLLKIKSDNSLVWEGDQSTDSSFSIDDLELFGGIDQGGGVQGDVILQSGDALQAPNAFLQAAIGEAIPAGRGYVGLIWNGIFGNQPRATPWQFQVQRTSSSLTEVSSVIGNDMNPAHILWEVLMNQDEGLGFNSGDVDRQSFIDAATVLQTEGFGLSFLWTNGRSNNGAQSFIEEVLRHIDAVIVDDPTTSKLRLVLQRGDYDPNLLPILGENEIRDVVGFSRSFTGELASTVVLTYTDLDTGDERTVREHNQSLLDTLPTAVVEDIEYLGITDEALAQRIAAREIAKRSQPLIIAKLDMAIDQRTLRPGNVFRLNWPALGVINVAMRVLSVEQDQPSQDSINVSCIEDIFARDTSAFVTPIASGWIAPDVTPIAPTRFDVLPWPYWLHEKYLTGIDLSVQSPLLPVCGEGGNATQYIDINVDQGSGYIDDVNIGNYTSGLLDAAIDQVQTTLVLNTVDFGNTPEAGDLLYVGDEWMEVLTWDTGTLTATVTRAVLGSLPKAHAASDVVWLLPDNLLPTNARPSIGSTPDVRFVPKTIGGSLATGSAPVVSKLLTDYTDTPYTGADLRLNAIAPDAVGEWNAAALLDLPFTWKHTDRTQQTGTTPPTHADAGIGPETGVEYTMRFYDGITLLRTETGITDDFYTYLEADQRTDAGIGGLDPLPTIRVELEADRVGTISHYVWDRTANR